MNFYEAIDSYSMVQRIKWKGENKFVFKQVPSEIPMSVVPKMQSLPEAVKNEFQNRLNKATDNHAMVINENHPLNSIRYSDQLAIVYPNNVILGWSPKPSDVLSNDWIPYVSE